MIQNVRWDTDADVIVIGYGAAGAVAAITAADGGARVLVMEKQDSPAPVNSSYMAMGSVICVADIPAARRYMETIQKADEGLYWTEPDIIDVWARYCAENKQWLESHGTVVKVFNRGGHYKLPGSDSLYAERVQGLGPAMMQAFYEQAKNRGVRVMPGHAATRLLVNSKDEVIGVRSKRHDGGEVNVRARRAVILATGGFEYDEQMKLQYLPVYPTHFTGSPASTGDGIRLALGVGAQLWHMNCVAAGFALKFPGMPSAIAPGYEGPADVAQGYAKEAHVGYVIVDRYGKRFTSETYKGHGFYYKLAEYDWDAMCRPRVPSYWVFDRKRMEAGPLVKGVAEGAELYRWSNDNSEELKRGWIVSADTVKELAGILGTEKLVDTVRAYNSYCKHGKDPDYGRPSRTLVPLSTPPYYAVKLWPGGPNTEGGPRRNAKAQVINVDGNPIPGLYGTGELGSVYGMLYPGGGGSLAECIAFGRVAGENAAEQAPR